jgi:hypothetical protein
MPMILLGGRPANPATPATTITGVTYDSIGQVLPACTVMLYRTATDAFAEETTSDGSGVYTFVRGRGDAYFAVAYKPGSPDVAGTTVNTLSAT